MKKLKKKTSAAASQQVKAYCNCSCTNCGATSYNTSVYRSNMGLRY